MKYLILHADGMADLACPELGGKTPLQAAATPHLDQIAQRGEVGLLSLPSEAEPAGSDVTSVAVLGYDPKKYYPGPGPLEAAGLGVTVGEQDVVFRCTMVTVRGESASGSKDRATDIKKLGPHVVMEDATAGLIDTEQARELLEAVNEQLGSEIAFSSTPVPAIGISWSGSEENRARRVSILSSWSAGRLPMRCRPAMAPTCCARLWTRRFSFCATIR